MTVLMSILENFWQFFGMPDMRNPRNPQCELDEVRIKDIQSWNNIPALLIFCVNRHTRESHIQRSFRTHCGTERQLGGAAAGPARSSRRKSTLLAVPSLLDEKEFLQPKFSSWSLIRADSGRYFHAMSARLRPIVQLKRITKWVSQFQTFPKLSSLIHQHLTRIQIRANC